MKSEVKVVNGVPRLFVNGVMKAPVFFYSSMEDDSGKWEVNEMQLKATYEYGYDLVAVQTTRRLPVQETGEYDFSKVARILDTVIQNNPDAKILLRCDISVEGANALEWEKTHPGDAMRFSVSREKPYNNEMTNETSVFGHARTSVTVASDAWAAAAVRSLTAFINWVESNPVYSEHVLGYHVAGGESNEWFHFALRERGVDVSQTNRKKYIQWLQEKYEDIDALNKAWNQKLSSFEQVQIPSDIPGNDRTVMAERTLFLQDGDQRFVDYCDYSSELMCSRVKMMAHCAKQAAPEKIVVSFYGYLFELYDSRTGHFRLDDMLDCPDIDALSSPIGYLDRNHGGIGALMSPVDSITAHGKLWFVENDIRLSNSIKRNKRDLTDWVPRVDSIEHGNDVFEREFGQMLTHNIGWWYDDLNCEGWHYHPLIWGKMQQINKIYTQQLESQRAFSGDVAVVVDERAMSLSAHADDLGLNLLYRMRTAFYRAGISFGLYAARDVENGLVKNAQAVFYLTPFGMDDDRTQNLCRQLRKNGSAIITMYGFGKLSDQSVKSLTGMNIQSISKLQSLVLKADPQKYGEDFTFVDNTTYASNNNIANPAYYIEDGENVEPLAYYTSGALEGKIAIAKCVHDGITSIHCCATLLTPEGIKEVCRAAGVHIYSESRDTFIASDRFVTLHAGEEPGVRTIRFAKPVNAVDLFQKTEYNGVTQIDLDMRECSTIVLEIK